MSDFGSLSPTSSVPVCAVREVQHRYGDQVALSNVSLEVAAGQIVCILGPNGSGKTTLFRLLCTLMPLQAGQIVVGGVDAKANPLGIRNQIGIVFQSPSLDKKLTVDENIACQGALYGITGAELNRRRDELLDRLRLKDRRHDLCETLSGGLKRRVELAKGMLHRPRLLLLDEPSTGLDPSARLGFWDAIREMADEGMAVLMTTHLLEEADKADGVVIMSQGKVIAHGAPHQLRAEMGEGLITIVTDQVEEVAMCLREQFGLTPQRVHHQLRLQSESPAALVPALAETLGDRVQSITVGRPGLEDVFIAKTGLEFVA